MGVEVGGNPSVLGRYPRGVSLDGIHPGSRRGRIVGYGTAGVTLNLR